MEFKTVIEVQAFGDFDILQTTCVMTSTDWHDPAALMSEFCQINNLPPKSGKGLVGVILYEVTNDYIAFLELKGFTRLQTTPQYFCD